MIYNSGVGAYFSPQVWFQWGSWSGHSQNLTGVPCNHGTLKLSGDPCPGNLEGKRLAAGYFGS